MGPSSIIGANAVRISRLDADGTPDFDNPIGAFALCGGISTFEHDYEIEEGADIFTEDAGGNACVIRKRQDRVKRVTFTLTMCKSDYRLDEILGVATSVIETPGLNVVGRVVHAAQGCGTVDAGNGVAIELWSEQWDCDVAAAAPYMRSVIPRAYLRPAGYTRENGVALPQYVGFGISNNNFGDGPFGDLDLLTGETGWVYAELDDDALPTCPDPIGYIPTPSSAS